MIVRRKTKRPVHFEVTGPARGAVAAWIEKAKLRSEEYLFPSRFSRSPHISARQYARKVAPDPTAYGAHSIRRTKATLICKRKKNLRAVQFLLGHSKLESTVRYLGIEVDDALEIPRANINLKSRGRWTGCLSLRPLSRLVHRSVRPISDVRRRRFIFE